MSTFEIICIIGLVVSYVVLVLYDQHDVWESNKERKGDEPNAGNHTVK